MGRPQKPFTVEVRRGRKGASSPRPAVVPKRLRAQEPAVAAAVERQFVAPPAAPPPAPRRILDAIEPIPVQEPTEVAKAIVAESDLGKPRRGRPPKSTTAVAPRKPGRPRLDPSRQTKAPEAKVLFAAEAEAEAEAVQAPVAPSPAVLSPVAQAAPREASSVRAHGLAHSPSTHGHVSHVDRAEAATSLPRGERWKRRVPKVLW